MRLYGLETDLETEDATARFIMLFALFGLEVLAVGLLPNNACHKSRVQLNLNSL